MKHKGIELVEVTEPQVFDPPEKMLVWDSEADVFEKDVCGIIKTPNKDIRVITSSTSIVGVTVYMHCAKIPEEPKSRRVTKRELAKWLANGNGEYTPDKSVRGYTYTTYQYYRWEENAPIDDDFSVRKWDDTAWHEPTAAYLGLPEDAP